MLEIAFNESAAGALKFAKSMKPGERLSGAVAVFGGTVKERREAKKPRVWAGADMKGCSADVAQLMLMLDIGDISDMDSGMNKRKELLETLFSDFPGVPYAIWETDMTGMKRLEEAKQTLEPVRMWICSGNPAELCGLCFVCHLMSDARTPLSVVRIPEQMEKDGCVVNYSGIGDVDAEMLGELAEYEKPIIETLRGVYADIWNSLVSENAPLRAVINGRLMGVPEDFYDFALRANIPEGEFIVARLIGKTLGKTPGVGDRWLYMRIQNMLRSGELTLVRAASDDHPYSGMVKRTVKQ